MEGARKGHVLELPGGQSLTGRLWDVLWLHRVACDKSPSTDRIHFEMLVDTHGNGNHELVKLWGLCGPGDDAQPVITVMLEGED